MLAVRSNNTSGKLAQSLTGLIYASRSMSLGWPQVILSVIKLAEKSRNQADIA